MAFTHKVCGQGVKAFCLMDADGTSNYWAVLCCPICKTTVTQGECTGTFDSSIEIYGQEHIPYGAANTFLRSNGAGVAPTWEVGPVGATGAAGAAGATGPAGTGYLALEAKQDQVVNNVTTLQSLCGFTGLTAGLLNTLTRRIVVKAEGFFTTAGGETPQLTFDIHMAAASQAAIQTDALTAGVTGAWWCEFEFLTHTTGGTGTLYRSGKLHIQLAGSSTVTTYIYAPTTATSGMDLTGVLTPILTITATSNLGTIRGTICSIKVE